MYLGVGIFEGVKNEIARTVMRIACDGFGNMVKGMNAVNSESLIFFEIQLSELQILELRLLHQRRIEGYAHKSRKPLEPRHDLPHHLHYRFLFGEHNGRQVQVRSSLSPCRKRFKESRPLRAECAVYVHYVYFHLALKRLHQCPIAGNVTKGCPRACVLLPTHIRLSAMV